MEWNQVSTHIQLNRLVSSVEAEIGNLLKILIENNYKKEVVIAQIPGNDRLVAKEGELMEEIYWYSEDEYTCEKIDLKQVGVIFRKYNLTPKNIYEVAERIKKEFTANKEKEAELERAAKQLEELQNSPAIKELITDLVIAKSGKGDKLILSRQVGLCEELASGTFTLIYGSDVHRIISTYNLSAKKISEWKTKIERN